MSEGLVLLIVGALLAGALAVSTPASRLRVPGLVRILSLGMLIGSDGLVWIAAGAHPARRRALSRRASRPFTTGWRGSPRWPCSSASGCWCSPASRAGLRGAVPVVLATYPVIARVPESLDFFNIIFFAVIVSTILQGTSFEPLARALKVTARPPPDPA